jgi:hypothetical protein
MHRRRLDHERESSASGASARTPTRRFILRARVGDLNSREARRTCHPTRGEPIRRGCLPTPDRWRGGRTDCPNRAPLACQVVSKELRSARSIGSSASRLTGTDRDPHPTTLETRTAIPAPTTRARTIHSRRVRRRVTVTTEKATTSPSKTPNSQSGPSPCRPKIRTRATTTVERMMPSDARRPKRPTRRRSDSCRSVTHAECPLRADLARRIVSAERRSARSADPRLGDCCAVLHGLTI